MSLMKLIIKDIWVYLTKKGFGFFCFFSIVYGAPGQNGTQAISPMPFASFIRSWHSIGSFKVDTFKLEMKNNVDLESRCFVDRVN